MVLTFKLDLDMVTMNHHNKYVDKYLFSSKVVLRTHTDTRRTDCSNLYETLRISPAGAR